MSLYSNIQALGNRMVSNLQAMGVSASFNDGGLTLADKILEIQHQTNGIVLTANKSIEQKGTTQNPNYINIYAFVMDENGHPVPDNTHVLFDGFHNENITYELESEELVWLATPISYEYWELTSSTTDTIVYIGSSGSNYFTFYKTSTGWNISYKDNATPTSVTWSRIIHLGDGLISDGNGNYRELSSVNGSSSSIVSNWEADYYLGYIGDAVLACFEDSLTEKGVAVYSYQCTGAGLKQFRAFCGRLVSQTYEVLDCKFYDKAIDGTGNHRTDYTGTLTPSYAEDGTILAETSDSVKTFIWNFTGVDNVKIEFDAQITVASPTQIRLLYFGADYWFASYFTDLNSHHFEFTVTNGQMACKMDNVSKDTISTSSGSTVMFALKNATMQFKNLKIYPI